MARIFWDTNLFIYLFEGTGELFEKTIDLRNKMNARGDELYTSSMTVGEILIGPRKAGAHNVARRYLDFFLSPAIRVLPFDIEAADHYSRIRQNGSIRPPDAIQLACSARAGVDLFVTNDERLTRLRIDGIHFLTSLDRCPL